MAVSCDSFNEEKNRQIGRHQSGKGNLKCLQNVRDWCRKYHVAFKINTVVNVYNVDEDMNQNIQELAPVRWKVRNIYITRDSNWLWYWQQLWKRLLHDNANDKDNDDNNDNDNDDENDNGTYNDIINDNDNINYIDDVQPEFK